MCGIFGLVNVSPTPVKDLNKFVSDALIAGAVRGEDSCGLAIMTSDSRVMMHKDVLAPASFLTSRATKAILDEVDHSYMVIGHNRAATVGEVTVDAAHPFRLWHKEYDVSIVGVHNGTLSGYNLGKDYVSDSEWLFGKLVEAAALDDEARDNQVIEILSGLSGAYSVMFFFDDDPSKMYVANNGRRPMHALMAEDGTYCLFASEPGMLHWLAERNKLKTTNNVMSAQVDTMYILNLKETKVTYAKKEIEWMRTFSSASAYDGSLDDLAKLQQKYNLAGATPPAATNNVVPFDDSVATADDTLAATIAAVRGTKVEFFVSEVDKNTRTVFGTFWPSDTETEIKSPSVQKLMYEGKLVIYCGRDEDTFNKMYRDPEAIWSGNIIGVTNIHVANPKTHLPEKTMHAVIGTTTIAPVEAVVQRAAV